MKQPAQHTIYTRCKRTDFQSAVDGRKTDLYFLKNKNGLEMAVTNFGARVVELWVPDKDGHFQDIVLGHGTIDPYVHYKAERFLGSTIGRYGNRIAKGQFTLNGTTYQLPLNNGPNSLHGGIKAFDMVAWDADQTSDNKIIFSYLSKDGEEGYPGNLSVTMTYELNDEDAFVITYHATTDKTTVINLTHHSFFNLQGEGNGTINNHHLLINADRYTPIDATLIPTGELQDVTNTPMDFRKATAIGSRLEADFDQLQYGKGYDHNWVLNRSSANDIELAAIVSEPVSGRTMEVYTTQPGMQFYGGNFITSKVTGKSGKLYLYRNAFAMETQHFPDSVNHPQFPSTVLEPGEVYVHTCIYKFGINKM